MKNSDVVSIEDRGRFNDPLTEMLGKGTICWWKQPQRQPWN